MRLQITEAEEGNIWFSADHHFNHANIIRFQDRPFRDVEAMNLRYVQAWNELIKPDDTVFYLGDFTLEGEATAGKFWRRLYGRIHVLSLFWHHDKRWLAKPYESLSGHFLNYLGAVEVLELPHLGRDGHDHSITLSHYPLVEWDRKYHGGWCLHGHTHGNYKGEGKILDVGVDPQQGKPISLAKVREYMETLR